MPLSIFQSIDGWVFLMTNYPFTSHTSVICSVHDPSIQIYLAASHQWRGSCSYKSRELISREELEGANLEIVGRRDIFEAVAKIHLNP